MADLAALNELCTWMRSVGATSVRVGDVALTLGQPPQPLVVVDQHPPPLVGDNKQDELSRSELETLLYSSGADPSMFLRGPR